MKAIHTVVAICTICLVTSCGRDGSGSSIPTNDVKSQPYYETPSISPQQPTYRSYSSYSPRTFMGYSCSDNCSGHEAGYEWAEENDVDDPDDCEGNSHSFIEGCQAYAEEKQAELLAAADED